MFFCMVRASGVSGNIAKVKIASRSSLGKVLSGCWDIAVNFFNHSHVLFIVYFLMY